VTGRGPIGAKELDTAPTTEASAEAIAERVAVKVVAPFQVTYKGAPYGPGQKATVDSDTAALWVRCGWVDLL
jgi:hypothetical protein